MIVITGSAGFIGSYLAGFLNQQGYYDLVLVDDFSQARKAANFENKKFTAQVDRLQFFDWLMGNHRFVQFVVHLGARTDTTEFDPSIFDRLNVTYSKQVWNLCVEYGLPLIYASSAATYGNGEWGYSDSHEIVSKLKPLNPYGESKNEFDKWVLSQKQQPFFWAGLKFFNVYGPNEYHKGRMASVVFHAFHQIKQTGKLKLFRSHRPDYRDGEQKRDFIYVKDVASVILFLMQHRKNSGLYNVGTGQARTFLDLAHATFKSMGIPPNIEFIDTPLDIRDKYQYFTQANMDKLRSIGYTQAFTPLEEGIDEYVGEYLKHNKYF
ncbi:MAG TPA: ADP-glyceromanno-heptose 6-epimerase [Bacteroidales bacterium]|nr:ADP-glyceromanno-heptose 6-epimerase [Bacteroidales bacterium]HOK98186.1 ADP-glyceromanno-heptose 6-epimerase [Bacteroidales bacterium]HPO65235.1 ADP-glyceromanno-heptose 6-epimerase [Bacteroidales bacterium]